MLKKFMSVLITLAMLGTMLSVPVFADGESTDVQNYGVTLATWYHNSMTDANGLYGRASDDVSNVRTFAPSEKNQDQFQTMGTFNMSEPISLSSGEKLKISIPVAWDDVMDYFARNSRIVDGTQDSDYGKSFNYLLELAPVDSDGAKNKGGIGLVPHNGTLQESKNGSTITQSLTPVMIPEKNWCTYEFVYTMGDDKTLLDVYADGVPMLQNHDTTIDLSVDFKAFRLKAPCSRLDEIKIAFDQDSFLITRYPVDYSGTVITESAIDSSAFNKKDITFAALPDGSLHYIGAEAQPSQDEMDALVISGSGVTTEFVSSVDETNDPGRIGYIRMTYTDGTVRYKKVMGGNSVDLLSLDFNARESLADSDGNLATSNREGGYMNGGSGTQNTHYTLSYKGGVYGKSDGNYAVDFTPKTISSNRGVSFSSRYDDTYTSGNMEASGIISYEFSLRIPAGKVKDKLNTRIYYNSTRTVNNQIAVQFYKGSVYYCKNDGGFLSHDSETSGQTVDVAEWNRYTIIVNTLTDEVSVYRNGEHKYTGIPGANKTEVDIYTTGVLAFLLTNSASVDDAFQVDDVVIRSVTSNYVPEKLTPSVSSGEGWISDSYRFINPAADSVDELVGTLNIPDGSTVEACNSDGSPASSFEEAEIIMIKNADESIIRYYDVVSKAMSVVMSEDSLVNVTKDGDTETTSALTFEPGTKRLTAQCLGQKEGGYQKLTVIIAAYNDGELVALGSVSEDVTTDRGWREREAELVIPEGTTVTDFKAFAFADNAGLATLVPWTQCTQWVNK